MSFDPSKLLIVLVVALIVLGPEKLPHFMRQAGKYLNEFRSMRDRLKSEVDNALGGITGATSGITSQITQQIDPIKDVFGQFKGQASNPFSIGGAVGSIFGTQTASNQMPNNAITAQTEG
ncbi:MAG: twin-arginine translocase TatA/TatE family subunit, partial [Acidimicrobiaceae bacterium]|nr:twin-arginine translocase TatA/TatE family subunit [Acidimicrobiaceae bacterium]